jgi:hypothetical protein
MLMTNQNRARRTKCFLRHRELILNDRAPHEIQLPRSGRIPSAMSTRNLTSVLNPGDFPLYESKRSGMAPAVPVLMNLKTPKSQQHFLEKETPRKDEHLHPFVTGLLHDVPLLLATSPARG